MCFSTEHPTADFGFCQFAWTLEETHAFLKYGTVPRTITELPWNTNLVAICYSARDLECQFTGPAVTPAQFRRFNARAMPRLMIWDLFGRDGLDEPVPLMVVPSDDVRPSTGQRELYAENMHNNYREQFSINAPLVTDLLKTGLYVSDYVVDSQGPLAYDGNDWSEIWKMLHRFAYSRTVEHPEGFVRHAANYRHPLHVFHQHLVTEYEIAARETKVSS